MCGKGSVNALTEIMDSDTSREEKEKEELNGRYQASEIFFNNTL